MAIGLSGIRPSDPLSQDTPPIVLGSPVRPSGSASIIDGTITFDPVRERILLIRWKRNGQVIIPKGREDINEATEAYEEMGCPAIIPDWRIPIYPLSEADAHERHRIGVEEPFALSQRRSGDNGKLVCWYVVQGDSTAAPDIGTQQEGEEEDFERIWADLDNVVQTLTFSDDKQVVQRLIDLYAIGSDAVPRRRSSTIST